MILVILAEVQMGLVQQVNHKLWNIKNIRNESFQAFFLFRLFGECFYSLLFLIVVGFKGIDQASVPLVQQVDGGGDDNGGTVDPVNGLDGDVGLARSGG